MKNDKKKKYFQKALLKWSDENLREFPWRQADKSPYFLFICELFLKRTIATTVNKYIDVFFKEFPKIEDLANSDAEKLKSIIKPFGLYNQRLITLQKISKQILTIHHGKIPEDYDNLLKLYGVGKYTANAFLCFYYKKKVPIVDPNVIRIFMRFFNFISEKKSVVDEPQNMDLS